MDATKVMKLVGLCKWNTYLFEIVYQFFQNMYFVYTDLFQIHSVCKISTEI